MLRFPPMIAILVSLLAGLSIVACEDLVEAHGLADELGYAP